VKKKEDEEGLSFFLVTNSYIGGKFNLLPQVRKKEQLIVLKLLSRNAWIDFLEM
jgi:hypothetical protein